MNKSFLILSLVFSFFVNNCFAQDQTLNWLDAHAVTLENNKNYLPKLVSELEGNAICGLGEASHGTHEFFIEKARIVKYLISNANYKAIGFEFGYTKMAVINSYLQTGKGDLKKLMADLRLFNTVELFDLFQSIKTYNDSQTNSNKVTLFGFDSDFYKPDNDASARYCIDYLTAHPALYNNTSKAVLALSKVTNPTLYYLTDLPEAETAEITALNKWAAKTPNTAPDFSRFKKHLSLLYQGTLLSNPLARDEFMATNIADFREEHNVKTIIWGHNVHLAKDTTMAECKGMGYYIKQTYQKGYYAIAFDTFKGDVTVIDGEALVPHNFEGTPNSFSALFAKAKYPEFFISLSNSAGNPLFNVNNKITNLFANWGNMRALPIRAGIDFNAVVFISQTTASMPLK
ncbi:erythromycin esterase family protein [Mucilaginibacter lutimaris]|uniref:Erythromycin esterase family protein n=1 Tax=Mucilaginibacter lutimaris TaxID=931629 RepID=A0ABW2ZE18_9SPHI